MGRLFEQEYDFPSRCEGVAMLDVMGYDQGSRRIQTEPCEREPYVSSEIKQAHAIGRLEAMLSEAQRESLTARRQVDKLESEKTSIFESLESTKRDLKEALEGKKLLTAEIERLNLKLKKRENKING